ncbi:Coagulation factor XI [Frankliniella fusca]|uniref:Coagulation factor XI n=1 Tax=Frankliniella fusca TaxID=407009 RepID=A0AAE1HNY5_9NEOP|nr:Coagulation factor XI [Frankliniella fusca]
MASSTATAALALFAVGLAAAPLRGARAASLIQGPVGGAFLTSDIAYPGQFPWHAAVHKAGEDANSLLGSGALVSQMFVLSAASIIPADLTGVELEVVLGIVSLRQAGSKVSVGQVKKHDQWTSANPRVDDLALLQLATSVELTDVIALVALPPWYYRGATYKDLSVSVSSWGAESPDYKDMFLREVIADVISNRDCQKESGVKMEPTQLCAHQSADDQDVVLGAFDGGDPAVFIEPSGVARLIGIMSAEKQQGPSNSQKPAVMARITEHLAWIAANSDADIGG